MNHENHCDSPFVIVKHECWFIILLSFFRIAYVLSCLVIYQMYDDYPGFVIIMIVTVTFLYISIAHVSLKMILMVAC